jgi:cell division protein FtsN
MSVGEMAFLGLVVGAFVTFIGSVGFISIWSRKPRSQLQAQKQAIPAANVASDFRKAA